MPREDGDQTPNSDRLYFRTDGVWTADDLATFSDSVRGLYDALLVVRVWRRITLESVNAFDRLLFSPKSPKFAAMQLCIAYPHMFTLKSLDYSKLAQDWPFERHPQQAPYFPTIPEIYRSIGFFASQDERLRVGQIRMASPGSINFEGLGEIVKEFRELVKDIWYRNKQEKVRGELDILKSYLDVAKAHPEIELPLPTYLRDQQFLVDEASGRIRRLRELEDTGKLGPVAKNIDHSRAVKRRR